MACTNKACDDKEVTKNKYAVIGYEGMRTYTPVIGPSRSPSPGYWPRHNRAKHAIDANIAVALACLDAMD